MTYYNVKSTFKLDSGLLYIAFYGCTPRVLATQRSHVMNYLADCAPKKLYFAIYIHQKPSDVLRRVLEFQVKLFVEGRNSDPVQQRDTKDSFN